jgi:hypothetical protein
MNGYNLTPDLQKAKQLAVNRLLRPNTFANVVGVGIGYKTTDGAVTPTQCVRVYVHTKLNPGDITPASLIPPGFQDIPTDVIEVGRFGRVGRVDSPRDLTDKDPITPGSPIRLQTSAPNVNSGAFGTLGAVAEAGKDRYILSCNHILNVNSRVPVGTAIVSAASFGAGTAPVVARSTSYFVKIARDTPNEVDCALARIDKGATVQAIPIVNGKPLFSVGGTYPALMIANSVAIGATVAKFGSVTGLTYGTVVDFDADFFVDYSFGTFLFTGQIVIDGNIPGKNNDLFASEGDSGSILVDPSLQAVGMVFAEAERFVLACPLWKVRDQFRQQFNLDLNIVLQ